MKTVSYVPGAVCRSGWLDMLEDCLGTREAIQTVLPLTRRSSRAGGASEKSLSEDMLGDLLGFGLDVLCFVLDVCFGN